MKICFICSSIEQGRHGIGDYVMCLAGETSMQGHETAVLALHDYYINEVYTGKQQIKGINLNLLRIPASLPSKLKYSLAEQWINDFNPEWLSLHFCPFSFNHKGIPLRVNRLLEKIGRGRRWHIMFHELWVGVEKEKIISSFIRSSLQKFIIKQLIRLLHPSVIHTHLPFYKLELEKMGLQVGVLPLFSNIVVSSGNQHSYENNILRIALFSQAEFSEPIANFLEDLEKQILVLGHSLEVLLIGGSKDRLERFENEVGRMQGLKKKVKNIGYLNATQVSEVLQICTIGLTPVPRHVLGKSGSVAAFITHGLPVAAPIVHPKFGPETIGFFSPKLSETVITEPDLNKILKVKEKVLKVKSEIDLSTVAKKFLSDLRL